MVSRGFFEKIALDYQEGRHQSKESDFDEERRGVGRDRESIPELSSSGRVTKKIGQRVAPDIGGNQADIGSQNTGDCPLSPQGNTKNNRDAKKSDDKQIPTGSE